MGVCDSVSAFLCLSVHVAALVFTSVNVFVCVSLFLSFEGPSSETIGFTKHRLPVATDT